MCFKMILFRFKMILIRCVSKWALSGVSKWSGSRSPILSSHVFSCLSMSTPQFRSFRPLRCIIHFALLQVMVPILHRSQHHFAVSRCDGPQGGSMHTRKYQESHAIRSCEDCEHCEGSGSRPPSRWVGVHECPEGDDRTQGRTSRWWWEMWRGLIGGAILRIRRFRLGHNLS